MLRGGAGSKSRGRKGRQEKRREPHRLGAGQRPAPGLPLEGEAETGGLEGRAGSTNLY